MKFGWKAEFSEPGDNQILDCWVQSNLGFVLFYFQVFFYSVHRVHNVVRTKARILEARLRVGKQENVFRELLVTLCI